MRKQSQPPQAIFMFMREFLPLPLKIGIFIESSIRRCIFPPFKRKARRKHVRSHPSFGELLKLFSSGIIQKIIDFTYLRNFFSCLFITIAISTLPSLSNNRNSWITHFDEGLLFIIYSNTHFTKWSPKEAKNKQVTFLITGNCFLLY